MSDKDEWNYAPETFNALYLNTKFLFAFNIFSRACLGNLYSEILNHYCMLLLLVESFITWMSIKTNKSLYFDKIITTIDQFSFIKHKKSTGSTYFIWKAFPKVPLQTAAVLFPGFSPFTALNSNRFIVQIISLQYW